MGDRWLNIGCGPHRAPAPWVNVDRVRIPGRIEPDICEAWPSGYAASDSVRRVYLGHVVEHMTWDDSSGMGLPSFLEAVFRIVEPGGEVMIVGPDVKRALTMWKKGTVSSRLLWQIMEHDSPTDDVDWKGRRHLWNCTVDRVCRALSAAGFVGVDEIPIQHVSEPWPVVARSAWQLAVSAVKPT